MTLEPGDRELEERLGAAFRSSIVPGAPDRLKLTVSGLDAAAPADARITARDSRPRFAFGAVAVLVVLVGAVALSGTTILGPAARPSSSAVPAPVLKGRLFFTDQAFSGDGWRIVAAGVGIRTSLFPFVGPGVQRIDFGATPDALATEWGALGGIAHPPSVDLSREILVVIDTGVSLGVLCGRVRFDGVTFDTTNAQVVLHTTPGEIASPAPLPPDEAVSSFPLGACRLALVDATIAVAIDRSRLPQGPFTLRNEGGSGGYVAIDADVPPYVPTPEPSGIASSPIASATDPADLFLDGQPMSGDGWRILATGGLVGEPTPGRAGELVVWSPESIAKLWSSLDRDADPPVTDPDREIVVSIGFIGGQGPICGQVRFEGTYGEGAPAVLHLGLTDGPAVESDPSTSGDPRSVPGSVCAAVGVPHSFVLALERDRLPVGPFAIQLSRRDLSSLETSQIAAFNAPPVDPSLSPGSTAGTVASAGFKDPNDGWALMTAGLYLTTDGGTSWTSRGPNLDGADDPRAVAFADADRGWLVTLDVAADFLRMWQTSDGGGTWSISVIDGKVFDPSRVGSIQIDRIDADHAVIARQSGNLLTVLYRTADGGGTWHSSFAGPQDGLVGDTYFLDSRVGWIAGGVAGDRLYRTTDGGATFSAQALPLPFDLEGLTPRILTAPRFFDDRNGLIAVDYTNDQGYVATVVSRTQDGGATWTLAGAFSTGGSMLFGSLDAWTAFDTQSGTMTWTVSAGAEWSNPARLALPPSAQVHLVDPDHGWALAPDADPTGLYLTTDGGLTWRRTMPAAR